MTQGTTICPSIRMAASDFSITPRRDLREGCCLGHTVGKTTDFSGTSTQSSNGGRRPF